MLRKVRQECSDALSDIFQLPAPTTEDYQTVQHNRITAWQSFHPHQILQAVLIYYTVSHKQRVFVYNRQQKVVRGVFCYSRQQQQQTHDIQYLDKHVFIAWTIHVLQNIATTPTQQLRAKRQQLRTTAKILLGWLYGSDHKSRNTTLVWQMFWTTTWTLSWTYLLSNNIKQTQKHHQMLRAMQPNIQQAIYNRDNKVLARWYVQVLQQVWTPAGGSQTDRAQHYLYCMFSSQHDVWYLGRAAACRVRNNTTQSGIINRFQEHYKAIIFPQQQQAHRPRYKQWRQHNIYSITLFPLYRDTEKIIHRLEPYCIQQLQPPTQLHSKKPVCGNSNNRPPPRLRSQSRPGNFELHNNIHRLLNQSHQHKAAFQQLHCNWQQQQQHLLEKHNWTQAECMDYIYKLPQAKLLALYLIEKYTRLDYARMWTSPNVTERVARVWNHLADFPGYAKGNGRKKLMRFLTTSHLLQPKHYTINIQQHHPMFITAAKQAVKDIGRQIQKISSRAIAVFLLGFVTVRQRRPLYHVDFYNTYRFVANHFELQELLQLTDDRITHYEQRDDIKAITDNLQVPIHDLRTDFADSISEQIQQWLQSIQQQIDKDKLQQYIHFNLQSTLQQLQDTFDSSSDIPDINQKPTNSDGTTWAVVDRNPKQRLAMDRLGYIYRMAKGFLVDSKHYEVLQDVSKQEAAIYRTQLLHRLCDPAIHKNRRYKPEELPKCYHTYKTKCLADNIPTQHTHPTTASSTDSNAHTLTCEKQHSHEREIVNFSGDWMQQHWQYCARALRILRQQCSEEHWTIWSQNNVTATLRQRVQKLHKPTTATVCVCGDAKNSLVVARFDAAQFFKNASNARGRSRTYRLLARMQHKGYRGVLVRKQQRCSGYVIKKPCTTNQEHIFISFDHIKQAITFAQQDRLFCCSNTIIARKHGWSMGQSMSEVATMIDINHSVWNTANSKQRQRHCGIDQPTLQLDEVIAGGLHVDDFVVFSRIYCLSCLKGIVERMMPEDIGIEMEEAAAKPGSSIKFLHTAIYLSNDDCNIQPLCNNLAFATGITNTPAQNRLPAFDKTVHLQHHLKQCILPVLLSYNSIVDGRSNTRSNVHTTILIAEILNRGWPAKWIANTFNSVPFHHTSSYARSAQHIIDVVVRQEKTSKAMILPILQTTILEYHRRDPIYYPGSLQPTKHEKQQQTNRA